MCLAFTMVLESPENLVQHFSKAHIDVQLHEPYYSLRTLMREVAEMIPHPDEEESNLSSQTLRGILVSLLGFLGKSKP